MNYSRVYLQLIRKRKIDKPISREECYCEKHHIFPRSEGGSNSTSNLVYLTPREHFIAHLLLAHIYDDTKMWCACAMMKGRCCVKNNSRTYQSVRDKFSKMKKGKPSPNKGRKASKEVCRRMSIAHKGKKRNISQEEMLRLRNSMIGNTWNIGRTPWNKGLSLGKRPHHSETMRGRKWYNNGKISIMAYRCPDGFREGRISWKKSEVE